MSLFLLLVFGARWEPEPICRCRMKGGLHRINTRSWGNGVVIGRGRGAI